MHIDQYNPFQSFSSQNQNIMYSLKAAQLLFLIDKKYKLLIQSLLTDFYMQVFGTRQILIFLLLLRDKENINKK